MKEHPILFSAPMIRAIIDGSKTQTRRVIKDTGFFAIDERYHGAESAKREREALAISCPYGQSGDRLWVRETWGVMHAQFLHDGDEPTFYRADYSQEELSEQIMPKWRPSIHMPRGRSRITLEITNVRVERLQEISETDVIAEGCPNEILYGRGWYRNLWESLNGADSWAANPWLWVIEFKREPRK